jgi:hypothetical protein
MYLIVNLLETLVDYSEKLYCDNNYKDQLIRIYHQYKWKSPQYIEIYKEGPAHKRTYIIGVENKDATTNTPLRERCISYGCGKSKKEGEQNAAKMALIIHGILKEDQYQHNDLYYPNWDKIENSEKNNEDEFKSDDFKLQDFKLDLKYEDYKSDDDGDFSDKSV